MNAWRTAAHLQRLGVAAERKVAGGAVGQCHVQLRVRHMRRCQPAGKLVVEREGSGVVAGLRGRHSGLRRVCALGV